MARKVVLIADPGIDGAFALTLALFDPALDVLGVAATPGNVSAEQATRNIHIVVEQIDPPRWPRLGAAPSIEYETDGTAIHGPNGLGGVSFPCATLHNMLGSEKLLLELVRQHPEEVVVVCLGPCTVLARALDMHPDLPTQVKRIIVLGGTRHEPGNAGPVSEFHFHCDPLSARQVLHCGAPLTVIPLDVLRRILFSPSDLLGLPEDGSKACRFLRRIVPFAIAATSNLYGIEGFHLKDVLGVVAAARPELLTLKPMRLDVETRGDLTRGMSVCDERTWVKGTPNVELAVDVDGRAVRSYLSEILEL